MSAKTINRLMVAIASLAVLYGLLIFWQYQRTAPGVAVPVGTAGLSRTADRLVIKSGGRTTALSRRGDKWFVGQKPVGEIKITTLLKALDKLTFVRVVAAKPDDLKIYGIDDVRGNILKIYKGKKLLRALKLGSVSSGESFYVKTDAGPEVYEAQGDLVLEVSQSASGWTAPERKTK